MKKKMCMLEDNKVCDNCCECDICDLDPGKVCDNCAKCINSDSEYISISMDELMEAANKRKKYRLKKTKLSRSSTRMKSGE